MGGLSVDESSSGAAAAASVRGLGGAKGGGDDGVRDGDASLEGIGEAPGSAMSWSRPSG